MHDTVICTKLLGWKWWIETKENFELSSFFSFSIILFSIYGLSCQNRQQPSWTAVEQPTYSENLPCTSLIRFSPPPIFHGNSTLTQPVWVREKKKSFSKDITTAHLWLATLRKYDVFWNFWLHCIWFSINIACFVHYRGFICKNWWISFTIKIQQDSN